MDIGGNDHAYEWSMDGQRWVQNAQGDFTLQQVASQPVADALDLDFAAGARLAPDGRTYLPAAFSHCPRTGQALATVRYDPRRRWLPPYGNGSGRRVVESSCALDGAEQTLQALCRKLLASPTPSLNDHAEAVVAPRKNGLNFLVANLGGHREALFALDREGGLFLWQSRAKQWRPLLPQASPIGRCSLPNWAWGVALRLQGEQQHLILAGEEGACEVSVDPLSGRYRLQRCAGTALGAPGNLEARLLVPQRMPDGRTCLVERTADGWLEHPIEGAEALLGNLSAPLSQPASRRLLWIGEQGYLSVRLDEGVAAQWLRWPEGAKAMPEYGPPFVDGYGTWQLLFAESQQYCLRLDSDERKEGLARLGTGHLNLRFNVRLDTPWADNDEYTNPTTRDVIYPFVEFSDSQHLLSFCVRETSGLQKFFADEQAIDTEYRLERLGEPPLRMLLKVARPWNAQWFFFDNALWLYIDSSGALYRWNV